MLVGRRGEANTGYLRNGKQGKGTEASAQPRKKWSSHSDGQKTGLASIGTGPVKQHGTCSRGTRSGRGKWWSGGECSSASRLRVGRRGNNGRAQMYRPATGRQCGGEARAGQGGPAAQAPCGARWRGPKMGWALPGRAARSRQGEGSTALRWLCCGWAPHPAL